MSIESPYDIPMSDFENHLRTKRAELQKQIDAIDVLLGRTVVVPPVFVTAKVGTARVEASPHVLNPMWIELFTLMHDEGSAKVSDLVALALAGFPEAKENSIRGTLSHYKSSGDVENISKGVWRLTPQGMDRLAKSKKPR